MFEKMELQRNDSRYFPGVAPLYFLCSFLPHLPERGMFLTLWRFELKVKIGIIKCMNCAQQTNEKREYVRRMVFMENQENGRKRLPFVRKIGYGIGDAGSNFCWTFVASFIMIYCTNTLGVNAAVIGTIMMLSKILDGITDVFMGRIIDATHSRMGKARFWLFVSSFPVALFTFLLFNVPAGFSENTKYVYIFIVYTLMGAVFYTMNNIAYSTLTALVTKNPKNRVEMGSYRFIFAIIAVLFMSSFTSGFVEKFGGGQQGWRTVSIIYSILCLVLLLIPVIAVKELPEEELRDAETGDKEGMQNQGENESFGFFKGFLILLKNKYFIMILLIYLVQYLASGITGGMGIYFATYQMGDAALLGPISMAGMLPIIVALPFVPQITAKFGIRNSAIAGKILGVLAGIILIIGGMTGQFLLVMAGLVLKAVGNSPLTGGLNALIAETDDYSELKFGQRLTGTIYSCSSVGIKVGTGIGTALCGILLEMGGFDGMAETQTATAIATINWSYLLASALPAVFLAVILCFLKVEKENKELREKREK